MRWHDKKYKVDGVWYIEHKRFLFIPMTIGEETRWLEFARWRECWTETISVDTICWQVEKWLDNNAIS
jgi:hypothetical protein